jgi:N-acetylneuraminate synthase
MAKVVSIGGRPVGGEYPAYIIAEIGINHNGDLGIAKQLIDAAVAAGCDAVKFQKRDPELCVPRGQRNVLRETPWGEMTYIEYRHRIEFGEQEYAAIDNYCRRKGIPWFASCWDDPSADFIEQFDPVCYKIASACLTDTALLHHVNAKERPVILSTGMSTMEQVYRAVDCFDQDRLLIAHCISSYCPKPEDLNLRMIRTLQREFSSPIGYSGHETGLTTTYAAVVLGASFVERHITLDRNSWGSDHKMSLDPWNLRRLVKDIRTLESALGDGVKCIQEAEELLMAKLRICSSSDYSYQPEPMTHRTYGTLELGGQ